MLRTAQGRRFAFALAIVSASYVPAAWAQSVNYGALEHLFSEPVTMSASGSPQRASEAPANMEIITAEDIRRSGADSIPDILEFVAGIDVRHYAFSQPEVSVRGYNRLLTPRLLVLVNGRQVYSDQYGYMPWSIIPVQLDEIRQIEIVRGPNTALFGFNAVGGVINIITYDPALDRANAVTARAGTRGYVGGSAVATIRPTTGAALRLSAGGMRAHEFRAGSNFLGIPYDSRPDQYALSADGRFKLGPKFELTTEATYAKATHMLFQPTPVSGNADQTSDSVKVGLSADTRFGLLGLGAYRNGHRFRWADLDFRNQVYVAEASNLLKIGTAHTLRVALEYRNNSFLDGKSPITDFHSDIYAATAMWHWQAMPRMTVTNSLRVDHMALHYDGRLLPENPYSLSDYNNRRWTAWSFNSAVVYRPTDLDSIRLSAARGIQAPSLVILGYQFSARVPFPPFSIAIVGSPRINASAILNFEAGYERKIESIGSTLRASVFHQKTTDVQPIGLLPTTAGRLENVGTSKATGGEISLKGQNAAGLRWKASYAAVSIADDIPARILLPFPLSGSENGTPESTIAAELGYSKGKFEVDVRGKWQSSFVDYAEIRSLIGSGRPVRVGSHVTMDARIGYAVTDDVRLALSGQNLLRERTVQSGGLAVPRRVILSATVRY